MGRGLFNQLDDNDLSRLRRTLHFRRHENVLVDPPVLGDNEAESALFVEASDDLPIGAGENIDDGALRTSATIHTDASRSDAVAVQRLAHFAWGEEKISTAVVGDDKAVAIGMTLHGSRHEIELGHDAQPALAVGEKLSVAFHRCESRGERLVLCRGANVERGRECVCAHWHAAFTQALENALPSRDRYVKSTRLCMPSARARFSLQIFAGRFL